MTEALPGMSGNISWHSLEQTIFSYKAVGEENIVWF